MKHKKIIYTVYIYIRIYNNIIQHQIKQRKELFFSAQSKVKPAEFPHFSCLWLKAFQPSGRMFQFKGCRCLLEMRQPCSLQSPCSLATWHSHLLQEIHLGWKTGKDALGWKNGGKRFWGVKRFRDDGFGIRQMLPSASPKVEVLFSFFGLHFWHLQLLLKQSETPF